MKNRKAFTLVELMAVIVILAIILALAVPKIFKSVRESKLRVCNIQLQNIKDATSTFFVKYRYTKPEGSTVTYDEEAKSASGVDVMLDTLYNYSLLKGKIVNPVDNVELQRTLTKINIMVSDETYTYTIYMYDSASDAWKEVVCE